MFWLPYRTVGLKEASSQSPPESPWLDPEFVESYSLWREASGAVRTAYDHWASSASPDRLLAWSAYRAALDREERAAHTYQASAQRIAGR